MSNQEREPLPGGTPQGGFERLEKAVEASVARVQELGREVAVARAERRRLEEHLQRFTSGEENPSDLLSRLQHLQDENRVLLDRLKRGREGVEKLLARIRFLEEQG